MMTAEPRIYKAWLNFALAALLLLVLGCAAPRGKADTVRIEGAAPGNRVIAMIDARTSEGCRGADKPLVLSGVAGNDGTLGLTSPANLLPSAGCNSQIAIFSEDRAMHFEERVTKWTDDAQDIHTVTLKPVIDVPITVWIASDVSNAEARAHDETSYANLLFRENRVGVRFNPTLNNVSGQSEAVQLISKSVTGPNFDIKCLDGIVELSKSPFYVPNTLNVYYVKHPISGRNCAIRKSSPFCSEAMKEDTDGNGNITFIGGDEIGLLVNLATLAHELGHAFGLRPAPCGGHTGEDNFGARNLMLGGRGSRRDQFSLGQIFRMNTHEDKWGGTMLISNGLRPQTGRECPPNPPASDNCPDLKTDLTDEVPSIGNGATMRDFLKVRYQQLKDQERSDPRYSIKSSEEEFIRRYEKF